MAKKKTKEQESSYLHETLLLRTEHIAKCREFLDEKQKALLFDKITEYSISETEYISDEEKESSDNSVSFIFSIIKSSLDYNWAQYQATVEQKKFEGTLSAIIGHLKKGEQLQEESISFLKENGFYTREYLKFRGIAIDVINKLPAIDCSNNPNEEDFYFN